MQFKDLKALITQLEAVPYPTLFGVEEYEWCLSGNEVRYVDKNGEVYSGELPEGYEKTQHYMVCNMDTQTGYWISMIFDTSKEISTGVFEDKYEYF